MPSKKSILEKLSRSELQDLAERHGLVVENRRVKEHLVEAAAASRSVALALVLLELSRERLKELCRALGLDDSGKEKSLLVGRLVGAKAPSAEPEASTAEAPPAGDKLTREQLEGYLWSGSSADGSSCQCPSRSRRRSGPRSSKPDSSAGIAGTRSCGYGNGWPSGARRSA